MIFFGKTLSTHLLLFFFLFFTLIFSLWRFFIFFTIILFFSCCSSFKFDNWIKANFFLQNYHFLQIYNFSLKKFNIITIIFSLFILILYNNLRGLFIFFRQNFLVKISCSLIFIALFFWRFSYLPFIYKKKEKFRLFIIGEIKFPSLSFLLSNIEILTHLFRPITLSARLWVNIWIGHLLIRSLSFLCRMRFLHFTFLIWCFNFVLQIGFFLFELGIICLQTFVFSYLVKVYFEENLHHRLLKFKILQNEIF